MSKNISNFNKQKQLIQFFQIIVIIHFHKKFHFKFIIISTRTYSVKQTEL